jgi:hypothetical protein
MLPCSLVYGCQHLEGVCCVHLQDRRVYILYVSLGGNTQIQIELKVYNQCLNEWLEL